MALPLICYANPNMQLFLKIILPCSVFICSQCTGANELTYAGCPLLLSQLSPDSVEWIFLTTRSGQVFDKGFSHRLHESMNEVFEPYFIRALQDHPHMSFEKMLRDQHAMAVSGKDGKSKYWGASHTWANYIFANYARQGRFRHESYRLFPGMLWKNWINPQTKLNAEIPFELLSGNTLPQELENIPTKFFSRRTFLKSTIFKRGQILYIYPPIKAGPFYLKAMEVKMERILDAAKRQRSLNEMASELSDYVQLGANGHVFNLANYSIFMTQMNAVLVYLGHPGLSPKMLDYHSMVENPATFRKRFAGELVKGSSLLSAR